MKTQKNNFWSILLLCFLCFPLSSTAQKAPKVILDNGQKASLQKSGTIFQEEMVQGYYHFYKIKANKYLLDIFDADLLKLGSHEINAASNLSRMTVYGSAFNGQNMVFKIYDSEAKILLYKIYNQQAEEVYSKTQKIKKYLYPNIAPEIGYVFEKKEKQLVPQKYNDLIPIKDKGFISYTFEAHTNVGYQIACLPNEAEGTTWTYLSDVESNQYERVSFLDATDDLLLNLTNVAPYASARDGVYHLLGLDMATGEKVFEQNLEQYKDQIKIIDGWIEEETEQIVLYGEFFEKEAEGRPSVALFALTLDMQGNVIDEKRIYWEKDAGQFLDLDYNGQNNEKQYTWIHKLFKTTEGTIYAIGEQFQKTIDGKGVAANTAVNLVGGLLGGSGTNVRGGSQLFLYDLIIYEFSPEFDLLNVQTLKKNENKAGGNISSAYSPYVIAKYLDAQGQFDYAFSRIEENGEDFSIFYLERQADEQVVFKKASWQNGNIEEQSIRLYNAGTEKLLNVFPAKEEGMVVSSYLPKEKRVVNQMVKFKK